ncbi:MAG: MFS transporter [Planctomycetaceae bacterium]
MTHTFHETRLLIARCVVLFLLAAASVIAYLTRHSLAVANTTIQKELNLNNEDFGWLYAAFSAGYFLFQIPGGWVGQRYGVRLVLPLLAIFWSLMTYATAFVPTFAGLLVIRFLFGLAQAGLVPNQALVVRNWISDQGRGIASSVMVVAMSVGGIASMALTSKLLEQSPWRSIFVAYSTLGIVWAVVFWLVFRSTPGEVGGILEQSPMSDGQAPDGLDAPVAPAMDSSGAEPTTSQSTRSDSPDMLSLFTSLSLWGLFSQALLKAAGYNLAVTFLPALLEYIFNVPPKKTGAYVQWSLIAYIAGSMLGGGLVDLVFRSTGSKYISRSVIAVVTLALAGVFTAIAGYSGTVQGTVIWLSVGAFFSGLASAAPWAVVMDVGGKSTAVIMGVMNSFAALAGVLLSPLVGWLIDSTRKTGGDWKVVFLVHGAYYLVAAASWLVVNPNQTLKTVGAKNAV